MQLNNELVSVERGSRRSRDHRSFYRSVVRISPHRIVRELNPFLVVTLGRTVMCTYCGSGISELAMHN
jgi:hypothetical protein